MENFTQPPASTNINLKPQYRIVKDGNEPSPWHDQWEAVAGEALFAPITNGNRDYYIERRYISVENEKIDPTLAILTARYEWPEQI